MARSSRMGLTVAGMAGDTGLVEKTCSGAPVDATAGALSFGNNSPVGWQTRQYRSLALSDARCLLWKARSCLFCAGLLILVLLCAHESGCDGCQNVFR